MSITTKELTKLCNVSRGTVDRALNGRPGINAETREKIQDAARLHNYRPHLLASGLSKGKSMSIVDGIIIMPVHAGIMGFDNLDILDYISPRITTVSISIELQGREAMNTLLKLISGESVPDALFVPHFICRGETL